MVLSASRIRDSIRVGGEIFSGSIVPSSCEQWELIGGFVVRLYVGVYFQ